MTRIPRSLCWLLVMVGSASLQAQSMWWTPPAAPSLEQWWMAPPPGPPSVGYPVSAAGPMSFAPVDENYHVSVTTDALILGRTGLDSQVMAVDGMGNTVLDPGAIEIRAQMAPRVSFFVGGRQTGLEFALFGVNDHSFFLVADDPGITPIFYGGIPANPVSSYDVDFQARLNSAELMFWKPIFHNVRFGGGIRGVGMNETYDIRQTQNPTTGFFSNTSNDLVGLQLGLGVPLLRRQFFYLDATGKTGVYHQNSDLNAISANAELHTDDNFVTAVTELNVGAEYHFGRHMSLRGGYFLLWLPDIAVGSNQNDDWDIINGTGAFDLSSVLYQGGYFGVQARW